MDQRLVRAGLAFFIAMWSFPGLFGCHTSLRTSSTAVSLDAPDVRTKQTSVLRDRPTHEGRVVAVIPAGELVAPIRQTEDYWQVAWNDTTGWVNEVLLRISKGAANTVPFVQFVDVRTPEVQRMRELEGDTRATVTGPVLLVRKYPANAAPILAQLDEGTLVRVIGCTNDWLHVDADTVSGYVAGGVSSSPATRRARENCIADPTLLEQMHEEQRVIRQARERESEARVAAERADREARLAAEDAGRQAREAERRAKLRREYGASVAERILRGEIWIGMTSAMARESMGAPDAVNRTVFAFGIHEQWVYDARGVYLYFRDGVLESWQD